jgi:hypothetical protein
MICQFPPAMRGSARIFPAGAWIIPVVFIPARLHDLVLPACPPVFSTIKKMMPH